MQTGMLFRDIIRKILSGRVTVYLRIAFKGSKYNCSFRGKHDLLYFFFRVFGLFCFTICWYFTHSDSECDIFLCLFAQRKGVRKKATLSALDKKSRHYLDWRCHGEIATSFTVFSFV